MNYFIDIKKYINNKQYDDLIFKDGEIIQKQNAAFRICHTSGGDNVYAENQEIIIDLGGYDKIYFLGNSDCGVFQEKTTLTYADGTEQKEYVEFWDRAWFQKLDGWVFDKEKIISQRLCKVFNTFYIKAGDASFKQYLFFCCIKLKENAHLKSIILPDNILMHYYAITLTKE